MDVDSIFEVRKGKIRYVELNTEDRKFVHQFLEFHYPNLPKFSAECRRFDYDNVKTCKTMKKCYNCKHKVVLEYHYGMMENNIDEYYSNYCDECDERVEWECNYDSGDGVIRITYKNKMLVFGDYSFPDPKFRHDPSPLNLSSNASDRAKLCRIMSNKRIYEIDSPDSSLSNRQLGWYLYWSLNEDPTGKEKSPPSTTISNCLLK